MVWSLELGETSVRPYNENHADLVNSVLCSEMAVKQIDEPFITAADDRNEWAL